jgi:hypothetical protein
MTALPTLLAAITTTRPGDHLTIDDVRDQLADLAPYERGEAFREACAGGWLVWTGRCQPSEWPAAKRRHVLRYRRTGKVLPAGANVLGAQGDTWENEATPAGALTPVVPGPRPSEATED